MFTPAPHSASYSKGPHQSQNLVKDEDFEVECIQDKRTCGGVVEYYVKWIGYHESENEWLASKDLSNARDLVNEYEKSLKKRKRFGKNDRNAEEPESRSDSATKNPKEHSLANVPKTVNKVRSYLNARQQPSGVRQSLSEEPKLDLSIPRLLSSKAFDGVGVDHCKASVKNINHGGTVLLHPELKKSSSSAVAAQSAGTSKGAALTRPPRRRLVDGVDFLRIQTDGHSGVESGKMVVDILGFKPAGLHIRRLDDVQYLINYADHPQEYVPHSVCVEHIPIHVTEYLARTPILLLSDALDRGGSV